MCKEVVLAVNRDGGPRSRRYTVRFIVEETQIDDRSLGASDYLRLGEFIRL